MQSILSLFPSQTLPVVVTDSEYARKVFAARGFRVTDGISTAERLKEAIFIPTDEEHTLPRDKLEFILGDAAVLVIPLMSFNATRPAIDYLLKRLERLDFKAACAVSAERIRLIEQNQGRIQVSSVGSNSLSIAIGSNPEVFLPKITPEIAFGEWAVISQFLEVALIPNEGNTSFSVDGSISCDGASVAFHSENWRTSRAPAVAAWRFLKGVREAGGFPLTLSISQSMVLSIKTSMGLDITPVLMPLTDLELHEQLIEMSFASVPFDEEVDWNINSQINEASGGVHVAIGTGVAAAHIDFISSKAIAVIEQEIIF